MVQRAVSAREYVRLSMERGSLRIWLEGAKLADERGWIADMARGCWVLDRRWTGPTLMKLRLRAKLRDWVDYNFLDDAFAEVFGDKLVVVIRSRQNLLKDGNIVHIYDLDEVDPRMKIISEVMES